MSTRLSTGTRAPEGDDHHEHENPADGRRLDEEAQIQGVPEASAQTGAHLENDGHDIDPSSGMSPDESARLWADLEAETGYASYLAYLNACQDQDFKLWHLRHDLKHIINQTAPFQQLGCAIIDVQLDNMISSKLTWRCSPKSETKILSALRQPPAATRLCILLWDSRILTERMSDALGLGLRIQPQFFHAFLSRHEHAPEYSSMGLAWNNSDDVLVIGQYVMTFVRNNLPVNGSSPPTIVIAKLEKSCFENEIIFQNDQIQSLDQDIPFRKLGAQLETRAIMAWETLPPPWMKHYLGRLKSKIEKGSRLDGDLELKLSPLVALLQYGIPLFHLECDAVRAFYLHRSKIRRTQNVETFVESIFEKRYLLRRMVGDVENASLRLQNYLNSFMRCDKPQSQYIMTLDRELQQILLNATRLEAEIRDYLQLQTGELALKESKKSIELSNLQIEEAKRVKIFTILAFVYVPLNLATSVFGMNIKQLNESGQNLSAFIGTAMTMLAITGGSWFVIEQHNSYRKWQQRPSDMRYNGKTRYALTVRLAMLVFLVSNGHSRFMLTSGVWWHIMMNNKSLINVDGCLEADGHINAGEYVSKYSMQKFNDWVIDEFDATRIEWADRKKN